MTGAHLLLLKSIHIPLSRSYALGMIFAWEKILLITAVAMVFSLFSTSTVSAITFTLFFWVLGHVSTQIRYLAIQAPSHLVAWGCRVFYYLAPNFEALNLMDFNTSSSGNHVLITALVYGMTYTAACLALTIFLFRKKEF